MPDPTDYKLSELGSASTITDNDLVYLAHYDSQNENYAGQKTTVATLGAKIAEGVTYNALQVPSGTPKQLVPAINYAINNGGGGGGGSSTLAGLTDVTITTPSDNDVLKYDSANAVWINGTGSAGTWEGTQEQYDAIQNKDPDIVYYITDGVPQTNYTYRYSTTEHVVGTWVDGSLIYEQTVDIGQYNISVSDSQWTNIISVPNISLLIDTEINKQSPNVTQELRFFADNGYIQGASKTSVTLTAFINLYVTFRYTKSSS